MDVAYNQHASHVRRKNRSTTNLNSLSLAPLTTRLPLDDISTDHDDSYEDPKSVPVHYGSSYLHGKSAPTTPRLLSRSPGPYQSRSQSRSRRVSAAAATLPKSKSTTHLQHPAPRTPDPAGQRRRKRSSGIQDELAATDADWVLRTGALMWTETRESKGQAWLLSRASSTSLAGSNEDEEPGANETIIELVARQRGPTSRHASRRGSVDHSGGMGEEHNTHYVSSPGPSRLGSRSQSRVGGVRGSLLTPSEQRRSIDGYFPHQYNHTHLEVDVVEEDYVAGPDFVNLDETLEAGEEDHSGHDDDEAHVRRLVKNGRAGAGTWLGNVLGNWGLSAVEENEEESDVEAEEEDSPKPMDRQVESENGRQPARRKSTFRPFDGGIPTVPEEEKVPPPKENEGGWQDAAWLLSVATKVLL